MNISQPFVYEHPQDVLDRFIEFKDKGSEAALIIVSSVSGGSVRAPGAIMTVSGSGDYVGYVSGGCIDADVVTQAVECIAKRQSRRVLYGHGSRYGDLSLPCGGAIEVTILNNLPIQLIKLWHSRLQSRQAVHVALTAENELMLVSDDAQDKNVFSYIPKLKIRLAGRGADFLAMTNLINVCRYECELQTPDVEIFRQLSQTAPDQALLLKTPSQLPAITDDRWTAFVLMFHDENWEVDLLIQALEGPAFYVGAIGSQRARDKRNLALQARGLTQEQINRVHGPVGLIPRVRNASFLGVSALSQIVLEFTQSYKC